jgi:predicted ArsR family transcriptional regulator
MDLPHAPRDDLLAEPTRARLFELLLELRRPASSEELSRLLGRHPNTVRVQLRRLAEAGLVERNPEQQGRGRPRHLWGVAPGAMPAGRAPEAYGQLGRWLARAVGTDSTRLADVERTGTEIGEELVPATRERGVSAMMRDALTGMGFQPRMEALGDSGVRFELCNCPYRDAVRENQPAVCALHRGITRGLLRRLDRRAALTDFVPRDPDAAGCLIEIALPTA